MQFQDGDIKKLADLSRITLTEHELGLFRDQLTSVLAYVEQIATVDVSGVHTPFSAEVRLRADTPEKSTATNKELMNAAPHVEEGHISVLSVK